MPYRLLLAAIFVLAATTDGLAQIYAWRDAHGTLVLSDRKADPTATTYAVPAAPRLRTTRPTPSAGTRERYEPLIRTHAAAHGLAPELLRAVIQVESGFNPAARSPKGAMGLMQLMPATARLLGVSDPWDEAQNIRGGAAYLRHLLDRFGNNEELALAAYNAGPEAVNRSGRQLPPYPETRDYVRRVARASNRQLVPAPVPVATASALTARTPGQAPVPTPIVAPSTVPVAATIYKTVEVVDGRPVTRYSSVRPASGAFEVVGR